MTMEVSRLAIEVTSTGIDDATKALQGGNGKGGLYGAATKTETAVDRLIATMNRLNSVQVAPALNQWSGSFAGVAASVAQLSQQVASLVGGLNQFTSAAQAVVSANSRIAQSNQVHSMSGGVVSNTLKAMTTAALAYASVNMAEDVLKTADAWQQQGARLTVATGSAEQAAAAQQALFKISQETRTPLEANVNLYARMDASVRKLGYSNQDALVATKTFTEMTKLSGATAEETASATLQLSHAMNEGYLAGQQFNSMSKAAPMFLDALAASMGRSRGEMKNLGSQGKLTADQIMKAFLTQSATVDQAFAKMPITFSDSLTMMTNLWDKAWGELANEGQFNQIAGQWLTSMSAVIPTIVQSLGQAFANLQKWVMQNQDGITQIWNQVKGLVGDVWNIAKAVAGAAAEIVGMGGDTNGLAFSLFVVRGIIATIADTFTLVKAVVAEAGALILPVMYEPMKLVGEAVSAVMDRFTGFANYLAKAADAVGMHGMAATLQSMGAAAENTSGFFKDMNQNAEQLAESLQETANDIVKPLTSGKGALSTLLNGQEAITEEMKKQQALSDQRGAKPPHVNTKEEQAAIDERARKWTALHTQLMSQWNDEVELRARMDADPTGYDKLGPAQKELINLQQQLTEAQNGSARAASALTKAQLQTAIGQATLNAALERTLENRAQDITSQKALEGTAENRAKQLQDEAQKLENQVASYGQLKGAVDELTASQLKQTIAEQDALPDSLRDDKYVASLQSQADALDRIGVSQSKLAQLQAGTDLDKLLDPAKAKDFTDTLTAGFGSIGKSLGGVVTASDKWLDKVSKIKAAQAEVNKIDPAKQQEAQLKVNTLIAQDTIASFADMAGAAKGFFAENSRGYKAVKVVEEGFRAWQMAGQIAQFAQSMGLITADTAAWVTGVAVKTAATTAATPVIVGASVAQGTAAAAAGIANQATGDPYSAFPRMAAMAAIMLALGFAVGGLGGGGGGDTSKARQATQGTGTVLGDATKQSESISKSIDLLANNSNIALTVSNAMLASLKSIQSALTGAVNAIELNGGSVTGSSFQGSSQTFASASKDSLKQAISAFYTGGLSLLKGNFMDNVTKLLGFGSSKSLQDSGIAAGSQTVGSVLSNGFQGNTYQDVHSSKNLMGISYSSKNSENLSALDPSLATNFTQIIQGMSATVTQAAEALGQNGADVAKTLDGITLSLNKISLKGLSADQIQTQLTAVFSAFGDQITTTVLGPVISKFQQAGEGLLQTAVRVAGGVDDASAELSKLGLTAINFKDIINTTGDVGAEIVRQSIELKEAGTGIGAIIENMQGTAEDIGDTYASLVKARTSLKAMGIATDVSADLLKVAGGLDTLQSSLDDYQDKFFSTAEKNTMSLNQLNAQFTALGYKMPTTMQGFRDLVSQLSSMGAAGQAAAVQVIALSGSFSDLNDTYQQNVSDAQSNLKDAYDASSQSIQTTIDNLKSFSTTLDTFKTGLLTGDSSPLSAQDKYTQLEAQYNSVLAAAKGGDTTAQGQFTDIANSLLSASKDVNASGAQYVADFQKVLDDSTALEASTVGQVSVAQQQLDALNSQVSNLITINTSVLSVTDAINALNAVVAAGFGTPTSASGTSTGPGKATIMPVINGSHAGGLANVPFDGYIAELHKDERVLTAGQNKAYMSTWSGYGASNTTALVDEIRGLRQQVAAMQESSANQTAAVITANYDAHQRSASTIVDGQQDAAQAANYNERAQVKLA